MNVWLTSPSRSILFQQQAPTVFSKENPSPGDPVISIDEKKTYQHIDGFGWALTDGSAQALMTVLVPLVPKMGGSLSRMLFPPSRKL